MKRTVKKIDRLGYLPGESEEDLESFIGKTGELLIQFREEPTGPASIILVFEDGTRATFFEDELDS